MESDLPPCEVEKRGNKQRRKICLPPAIFSLSYIFRSQIPRPLAALSCPIDVHFSFPVIIIEAADFQSSQLRPIAFKQ